jgi:hypothetical protein
MGGDAPEDDVGAGLAEDEEVEGEEGGVED